MPVTVQVRQGVSLSFHYQTWEGIILLELERLLSSTEWISQGSLKNSYIRDLWKTLEHETLNLNLLLSAKAGVCKLQQYLPHPVWKFLCGRRWCFSAVSRLSWGSSMYSKKTVIKNQLNKHRQDIQLRSTLPIESVCWVFFYAYFILQRATLLLQTCKPTLFCFVFTFCKAYRRVLKGRHYVS